MSDNQALNRAKSTLTHYFKLCFPADYQFNSDNYAEIEGIVDDIYQAAKDDISSAMNKHGSQYHT